MMMPNLNFKIANALYIHIPFCSSKCPYCDFYSTKYTKKKVGQYWAALFLELEELSQKVKNNYLQTIYFGGGTPSLIEPKFINALIRKINKKFKVSPTAEITMEVNPVSINERKIISLKRAGINRLSVGVQSFNDHYLSFLGRESTAQQNKKTLKLINKYFNNYSADLIFALPGQTVEEFMADLKEMIKFKPPHISLYNLEIPESTPFYKKYQAGELKLPPEEVDAKMYDLALNKLQAEGYNHYEISNFSQSGFRARHNYLYWLYQPYLALGPGAAGFDGQIRYQNKRDLSAYLNYYNPAGMDFSEMKSKLNSDKDLLMKNIFKPNDENKVRNLNLLDKKERMAEYSFLALRTSQGLFFHKFYQEFKINFNQLYQAEIKKLTAKKLIKAENQRLYLTTKGKKLANEVFFEFL